MPGEMEQRTEPATPRRRGEARGKGQVARSADLTAAMTLLAAVIVLRFLAPRLWQTLQSYLIGALSYSDVLLQTWPSFEFDRIAEPLWILGLFVIILFIVGFVILLAQVGWLISFNPITPSLAKINPIAGFLRLFSPRSFGTAGIGSAKIIVVGAVGYVTIRGNQDAILKSTDLELGAYLVVCAFMVFDLCLRLAVAMVLLALIDYAWQKYRHERDLRMTKEEVRDELRSMEGDPQIKRRRRQTQLQMMMRRLRKDVPQADVIVTNPTHYAVAISYDSGTMSAPKVVAKGVDYAAIRIRQLANEFGIPIVERRPLARALYDSVNVGQYIPERFYRAIAEILAYVYELTTERTTVPQRNTAGAA